MIDFRSPELRTSSGRFLIGFPSNLNVRSFKAEKEMGISSMRLFCISRFSSRGSLEIPEERVRGHIHRHFHKEVLTLIHDIFSFQNSYLTLIRTLITSTNTHHTPDVTVVSLLCEMASRRRETRRQISKGTFSKKLLFRNSTTRFVHTSSPRGKAVSLLYCKLITVRLSASSKGSAAGNVRRPVLLRRRVTSSCLFQISSSLSRGFSEMSKLSSCSNL